MKRILIADASKASLVMTSEVFKDHFPGVQVVVARTSADAIELSKSAGELDAFIIDYDLPDRDGASTAAKLKKMHQQPILITAFDRPDVQQTIDRDLSAFDDCLSWLKKPVKPELVVSLAQRFIEGKHRCQRRLACSIPAFLEVEFNPAAIAAKASAASKALKVARAKVAVKAPPKKKAAAKDKEKKVTAKPVAKQAKVAKPAKGVNSKVAGKTKNSPAAKSGKPAAELKKTSAAGKTVQKTPTPVKGKSAAPNSRTAAEQTSRKKQLPAAPLKPVRKIIPVMIDDVSLGGAKLRIQNQELTHPWMIQGKPVTQVLDMREGQILNVHVPPSNLVEAGASALEKWQKVQAKELNAFACAQANSSPSSKSSKSSTLSPLAVRIKTAPAKPEGEGESESESKTATVLVLKGEVRWTASSEMFTFCGLRSETVNVSKKLFESMIEIESRSKEHLRPMVSPNMPRGPKLNA
jgi:CheY-like chemotaxis protein